MPWRGVTVSEQCERSIADYQLNYYSVTKLAERFGISRKTANTILGTRASGLNISSNTTRVAFTSDLADRIAAPGRRMLRELLSSLYDWIERIARVGSKPGTSPLKCFATLREARIR